MHDLGELVVLAGQHDAPPGSISLPAYLDTHGDALRAAYVAFIHELGAQDVQGRSLAAALTDHEGFSYWWMTHLAEKSPFKSPRIYDCLRLLGLEMLMRESAAQASCLVLYGGDVALSTTLASFCGRRGLAFRHQPVAAIGKPSLLSRLHHALPWRLKGLLSMRHWLRRWSLRGLSSPAWFTKPKGVLFCSYFFNLDGQRADAGSFYSRQWELLPAQLQRDGWRLNWLHHMLLLPGIRSVREALEKAMSFNADGAGQGCHSFVESQLSVRLIAGAALEWLRIGQRASKLRPWLSFVPAGSQLDLWPLLEDDWETSLTGSVGLANCIWRRLFDQTLLTMPAQAGAFYLWENQGWEVAFLHAWRRHQRSQVIGFPHATTAFWHVNNFDDPRLFADNNVDATKPLPDLLAVSGPMAWHMFVQSGYPSARMAPVEAVRFLHLLQRPPTLQRHPRKIGKPLKILLLGDFSREQSRAMGACLAHAARMWGGQMELTVKPHPITLLGSQDLLGLSFTLSDRPLGDILQEFDLAFASNSSSAALDAWLYGVPVAVFLDDSSLNHSPMRGAPGACFVSNGVQLARVLAEGVEHPPMPVGEFFWLDGSLYRWRQLVAQATGQVQTSEHNP
ncbi:TIGR04326 family surface carbohydrate biosynthesis protein [Denitratisoma sp. agr-D3]